MCARSRIFLELAEKAASIERQLSEIAGSRVLFLTLFLSLPLNEFFQQSLRFFGPFFSRSSGPEFGNSMFRVFGSLYCLKLHESLKQRLGVFGLHLSRQ